MFEVEVVPISFGELDRKHVWGTVLGVVVMASTYWSSSAEHGGSNFLPHFSLVVTSGFSQSFDRRRFRAWPPRGGRPAAPPSDPTVIITSAPARHTHFIQRTVVSASTKQQQRVTLDNAEPKIVPTESTTGGNCASCGVGRPSRGRLRFHLTSCTDALRNVGAIG